MDINYNKLAKFVVKHSKLIIIITAIFVAVFGYFASRLQIDSDLMAILPKNDKIYLDYLKEQQAQKNPDIMAVLFSLNPDSNPEQIAKEFYNKMIALKEFKSFAKIDVQFLMSYGIMGLGSSDIIENITQNVKNLIDALSTVDHYNFDKIEYLDKTLQGIFKVESQLNIDPLATNLRAYYTVSPQKTNKKMLMGVSFVKSANDMDFSKLVVKKTKEILQEIEKKYNIKVGLTNAYIYQQEQSDTMKSDFDITLYLTFALILIIFYFSFGNIWITTVAFIALLVSQMISTGIVILLFGKLNVISNCVIVITLGIGIDYGINTVTRLMGEFNKNDGDFEKALEVTYRTVLIPLAYGVTCTAAVFLFLILMGLPAFVEMGIASSIGLYVFFIIMVFVVPAFMNIFRKTLKMNSISNKMDVLFQNLGKIVPKNGKKITFTVISVSLFLMLFGIYNAFNFSYTPKGMIPEKTESVTVGYELAASFSDFNVFDKLSFVVGIDEDVNKYKKDILKTGAVKNIETLPDMIEKKIGKFSSLKSKISEINEVIKNPVVISLLKKYNIYTDSLKIIDIAAKSDNVNDFSISLLEVLPDELKSTFFIERDNQKYITIDLYPQVNLYRNNGLKFFYDKMGPLGEKVQGASKTTYKIMQLVSQRFIFPMALSFLFIGIISYFSRNKNLKEAFETLLGLTIISFASFGIAFFLGIKSSFITLLMFPLIFGIGVDGFILIYHAIDEDKEHYWQTLKSITLSFSTTLAAFLSFQIAQGELIKEFALAMSIAIFLSWIVTVVYIPASKRKKILEDKKEEEAQ